MKLFHGTTLNRFKEIQESGFIGADCYRQIWNASEAKTTYFWTEEYIIDNYDLDMIDGNIEDLVIDHGKRLAGENAEIALASERSNLRRVVMMFDSEDFDEELTPDWSHKNMGHCYQYTGLISTEKIKKLWIDTENLDLFSMFFIGMAVNRNDDNGWLRVDMGENEKLPSAILEASQAFFKALQLEWLESISYDFELEEHYIGKNETLINSYSHEVLN